VFQVSPFNPSTVLYLYPFDKETAHMTNRPNYDPVVPISRLCKAANIPYGSAYSYFRRQTHRHTASTVRFSDFLAYLETRKKRKESGVSDKYRVNAMKAVEKRKKQKAESEQ
jgi:hypothetical protein